MHRRTIQVLFGAFLYQELSEATLLTKRFRRLLRCKVAGLRFRKGKNPQYRAGKTLSLRRKPANHYNPNAIVLYRDVTRIGLIPRRLNSPLVRLMDAHETL